MIVYFAIYSFIGWLYESIICSLIKYGRVVNRGFLVGPYCPIYGYGALLTILLVKSNNILLIFTVSILISTGLEYITAYFLEKVFLRKWWDYSHFKFNLHGRVCLYASLIFGVANVLLVMIIHPYISHVVTGIDKTSYGSVLFLVLMGIDTIYSLRKHYSYKKIAEKVYSNTALFYDYSKKKHQDIKEKKTYLLEAITYRIG